MNIEAHVALLIIVAATIGLCIVCVFLVKVAARSNAIASAKLFNNVKNDYFNDPRIRTVRLRLSQYGLKRLTDPETQPEAPSEVFELFDFFDSVASLYNYGVLDKTMVFSAFYYWISRYWAVFGPEVREFAASTGIDIYAELELMVRSLTTFGISINRISADNVVSRELLIRFFNDEIRECEKAL